MNIVVAFMLASPAMAWDLEESEPFVLVPEPEAIRGLAGST